VQRGRRRRRKTHAHLGLERRSKSGRREGAARGGGGRKETLEGTPRERDVRAEGELCRAFKEEAEEAQAAGAEPRSGGDRQREGRERWCTSRSFGPALLRV